MAQNNSVQEAIVRQSSLKFSLEYYALVGFKPTTKEVIGLTNAVADYCTNGYSKELGETLSKIDKVLKIK